MDADAIPVLREFAGDADLDRLVELLVAVAEHDKGGIEVSIDEIRFEWIDDEPGWIRDLRVWEAGDHFAAVVGVFHAVDDEAGRAYIHVDAHPDWREPAFVDDVVNVAGDAAMRLVGRPGGMRSSARPGQEWKRSGLERSGFEYARTFYRMSAPLTETIDVPPLPEGLEIRPLDPLTEVEAWVVAANAGFAEHWDEHPETVEEKRHRMTEPGYLPGADLVLVNERGELGGVGFNARETLADGSQQGWVHSLAVVPEYRGRKLGRALLLASMRALQDAGFERAHLTVDAGNESGALQLYTSAGFAVAHEILAYSRDFDPV